MTNVSVDLENFNTTSDIAKQFIITTIHANKTNGTLGEVNQAGIYRASDFIAMAVVFSVILVLSVLWQKRFPPFCWFKKAPPKDDTFENAIPPSNSGKKYYKTIIFISVF